LQDLKNLKSKGALYHATPSVVLRIDDDDDDDEDDNNNDNDDDNDDEK